MEAGEKGLGVVADDFIKKGTFVAEYIGEVISREEAIRRAILLQTNSHNYIFTINEFIKGSFNFIHLYNNAR